MVSRDIRGAALFQEVERLYASLRKPGAGQISDAAEPCASPDGARVVFSGIFAESLEKPPVSRICVADVVSEVTRVLTSGPRNDRHPRFSPDGRSVAFLSDRGEAGNFQLYLLDPTGGACRATPPVEGWVEYLQWSPDGRRILLGVAGHGADLAGCQGAIQRKSGHQASPTWVPSIDIGEESCRERCVYVYTLGSEKADRVQYTGNIWEATWCGNEAIAAVCSDGSSEDHWYAAALHLIDLTTEKGRLIYTPQDQIGMLAGSPSGHRLVFIDAICSDRLMVAGDVCLIDPHTGQLAFVDTQGVDVVYAEWRSEEDLLLVGHRGFALVIGVCHMPPGVFEETWSSEELGVGGRYATVTGFGTQGDCFLIGESFVRAPELGRISHGVYDTVRPFDCGYASVAAVIDAVEAMTWASPDGVKIQGWLLRPKASGPRPLIMVVHGGPVWQARPVWLGRGSLYALLLLKRGHAIFFPNPRGSIGHGRHFARSVLGDMGGADSEDLLSGLDQLVRDGIADPERLGVMGGSYGGFMTSWLITQDSRFAAAAAIAPITNPVSEYWNSNIPAFMRQFLGDTYTNVSGRFYTRSPIMYASNAKTPTLHVCGSLDRCTPPDQAVQFHHALLANNVKSVLLTYPEEGHGIRQIPALFDYTARLVGWFAEHLAK